jgi:hypothetical protein
MLMATDQKPTDDPEILAAHQAMWDGFVKFSTYSIVGVAVVLILMALFLL